MITKINYKKIKKGTVSVLLVYLKKTFCLKQDYYSLTRKGFFSERVKNINGELKIRGE